MNNKFMIELELETETVRDFFETRDEAGKAFRLLERTAKHLDKPYWLTASEYKTVESVVSQKNKDYVPIKALGKNAYWREA